MHALLCRVADDSASDEYPLAPQPEDPAPPPTSAKRVIPYEPADASRRRQRLEELGTGPFHRNVTLPACIVSAETLLAWLAAWAITDQLHKSLAVLGVTVTVNLSLAVLAAAIAVKATDVTFGPHLPALLKLSAIAVGPAALAGLLGFSHGACVLVPAGLAASFPLCWWMFSWLFELDFRESMVAALAYWSLLAVFGFAAQSLLLGIVL